MWWFVSHRFVSEHTRTNESFGFRLDTVTGYNVILRAWLVRHRHHLERTKIFVLSFGFVFVLAHEQANTWKDLTSSKLRLYTLLALPLTSAQSSPRLCYTQEMNGAKITLVTFPVTAHFYGVRLSRKSCSHTDILLLVKVLFTAAHHQPALLLVWNLNIAQKPFIHYCPGGMTEGPHKAPMNHFRCILVFWKII